MGEHSCKECENKEDFIVTNHSIRPEMVSVMCNVCGYIWVIEYEKEDTDE